MQKNFQPQPAPSALDASSGHAAGLEHPPSPLQRPLLRVLLLLTGVLGACVLIALWTGYREINFLHLQHDEVARNIFFRLRLPRVVMGGIIGASLALVGAALQALFRNPLADPFTLGVSGGGGLGAAIAISLGWGARVSGIPLVFLAAFAGGLLALLVVYRIARTGLVVLPGALLLAGVVVNLISWAGVLTVQYISDQSRALQILRWLVGSLDVVGFDVIWRMLIFLVPGWLLLMALSRQLQLLAVDEETAASLGVNVRLCERLVYIASSLLVGVIAAVGGTVSFVGLIVPHTMRLLFGQDLRIVLPASFLAGAAFLMLADAVGRTAFGQTELPVGAVTAILGGPFFLWLLRREQRYTAL
jgi:iron complex transport system permease protein